MSQKTYKHKMHLLSAALKTLHEIQEHNGYFALSIDLRHTITNVLTTARGEGTFGPCHRCNGDRVDPDGKSLCRKCSGTGNATWDEELA